MRARSRRTPRTARRNPPDETPAQLEPLIELVRDLAVMCRLRGRFALYRSVTGRGAALRGQCENAAALFHLLAGGTAYGWRMMRIGGDVWEGGPHYFVRHLSGMIVDPTADQFPPSMPVPYTLGRGQSAGGFRKVPRGTFVGGVDLGGQTAPPEVLRAALRASDAEVAGPMASARVWALARLP